MGRIATLKEQLRIGEQQVTTAERIIESLTACVDHINSRQLELMVHWHQNEIIDWNAYASEEASLKAGLRQAVENVVRGQMTSGDSQTLIVSGKHGPNLKALWDAYRQLAQRYHWQIASYRLTAYDPLLNPQSPEYRKRVSEKKLQNAREQGPSLHLLSEPNDDETPRRVADAYLHDGPSEFDLSPPSVLGFAIQIVGEGVASWFGEESGIVHLFDARSTGPRRRMRYRVDVFSGRLSSIMIPKDWPEPISPPERDPRKLISIESNQISGFPGTSVNYSQGKLAEGLVELMTVEHERALWKAIGYNGIPADAQLANYQVDASK
jgi:hypothetical protein